MVKTALWLYAGVCVWSFAFCSIKCPDGTLCPDMNTCCLSSNGYECCQYPKAVCCSDLTHCCPSEYSCDLSRQLCVKDNQPWLNTPMLKRQAAEAPSIPDLSVKHSQELTNIDPEQKAAVVYCDNYYYCPDGTTCCLYAAGGWFCCPFSPGRCCMDRQHCCPSGYDCDYTFTHCVRRGLRYPFISRPALTSVPASLIFPSEDKSSELQTSLTALTEASSSSFQHGVIRCDDDFYCSVGSSCCNGPVGQWNCCPFPLGTCCADGRHCCQYGCKCDPSSSKCTR
uniref:Granulins domain-containing protein n=1 Tax=Nothobranchius korthausae TaxID=1143690 RepID=A0A1A8G3C5_9TELE